MSTKDRKTIVSLERRSAFSIKKREKKLLLSYRSYRNKPVGDQSVGLNRLTQSYRKVTEVTVRCKNIFLVYLSSSLRNGDR